MAMLSVGNVGLPIKTMKSNMVSKLLNVASTISTYMTCATHNVYDMCHSHISDSGFITTTANHVSKMRKGRYVSRFNMYTLIPYNFHL